MKKIRYIFVLAILPLVACAALGIGGTTSEISHHLLDDDYEFPNETLEEGYHEAVEIAEEAANDAPDDGEVLIIAQEIDPDTHSGRIDVQFYLDGDGWWSAEGREWRERWIEEIYGDDESEFGRQMMMQSLNGSRLNIEYFE